MTSQTFNCVKMDLKNKIKTSGKYWRWIKGLENDPISMDQAKPHITRWSHETDLNWDNRSRGLNFRAMFS